MVFVFDDCWRFAAVDGVLQSGRKAGLRGCTGKRRRLVNIALVLSGGTGSRMEADIPKQYIEVGGKPIFSYCVETLVKSPLVDGIQIVAEKSWRKKILKWISSGNARQNFNGFSDPGKTRQLSILNGLTDIRRYAGKDDLVLVHDAARPLLACKQVEACFQAAKGHDGVMPVLPMKDTVYYSGDGRSVSRLLDRGRIFAGQAPEVFSLGKYYDANVRLLPDKILSVTGSAEPAVLAGMDIVMIPGDEGNFKITTRDDLEWFERRVAANAKKECVKNGDL